MGKQGSINKTITLTQVEKRTYKKKLIMLYEPVKATKIKNKTINQDLFTAIEHLPNKFVDLLFIDPPYNMYKKFKTTSFKKMAFEDYIDWFDSWLSKLVRILKPTASIYICGDYISSLAIYYVGVKYFILRNRIVWEREKGRGAKYNWKNNTEDIWYFTMSDDYKFNVGDVKLKKKVIAPYKVNGQPKDWKKSTDGNFRLTHPSNIWTDITVPFWSMKENTEHPTQKPEKLLAKIILASSNKNDLVFDPFLGSGTTSVVAKKLKRNYLGIEIDETFACVAEKRLALADKDKSIKGYSGEVFWERNSLIDQTRIKSSRKSKE